MKIGETYDVPKSHCIGCGEILDCASELDEQPEARPHPGSITICLHCGTIMAFADDLTLRALTDEEMHIVAGDQRIILFQHLRAMLKKEKKEKKEKS